MRNMKNSKKLIFLITGGAGFIGSAVIRHIIEHTEHTVINLDKLTYAGNLDSLVNVEKSSRYKFVHGDICDEKSVENILKLHKPNIVMHLAAESHVDRSIDNPKTFIENNIIGTFVMLEQVRRYWSELDDKNKEHFRFHHISTDEVYGDLNFEDTKNSNKSLFTEHSPYKPSSPYSASKASSDHLVRSWNRTFSLPTIVSNCSNNYGPYQFPEKLIPLMIFNALDKKPLPVYGNGNQIRDWLYVEDHARALFLVATKGKIGETYNIGGHNEEKNIDIVKMICSILDQLVPTSIKYDSLIKFVADRPGHDLRYAIDATKIQQDLDWTPLETLDSGLYKTVKWYLDNKRWSASVNNGDYKKRERLGSQT